ncbi:MAG: hypothetical protein L0Y71_18505 [Gemmataceae bacterium]|nr:hypothetical protein [Gemmataceae bacterium]
MMNASAALAEPTHEASPSWPRRAGAFLLWSALFGLAYTQAALYYSNQNQYFLHGLADAGRGEFAGDWLANTRDPTPVFSTFVAFVGGWLDERLFYVIYVLLLGLYLHSLRGIADRVAPLGPSGRLLLATLLVALHAGITRLASAHLLGVDYPWYFQTGVAGQYLLGFGLQPSVFGVFLLASILAFLQDRPWAAATWAALAAVMHATYLPAAGMLVLAYVMLLWSDRRVKQGWSIGLWALLLVAPIVAYSLVQFAPISPETFAESQRILAHVRIPHHAEPERWFDGIALAQVLWIVAAIGLAWGTRLVTILAIVFALSLVLTVLQVVTGNDTLALLFPWRTSAVLMPVATTIILARLVQTWDRTPILSKSDFPQADRSGVLSYALLTICVAGGLAIMHFGWGFRTTPAELPLLEYIKANKAAGDTYLIPVELPKPGRGAASTNFTPAPRRSGNGKLIAIDLQRFRLFTGAPLYVDFKSIPYQDIEVLEWLRRMLWAKEMYARAMWVAEQGQQLERERITHVVAPADRPLHGRALDLVYEDESYRLYRVAGPLE